MVTSNPKEVNSLRALRKAMCVFLSLILLLSVCGGYFSAAAKAITGLKIITVPDKTVFQKDVDWVYGLWEISEETSKIEMVPSGKISFTHNPCCGIYPDRGMLDMSGLSIEVSYSDGTTAIMEYTEAKNKNGIIYPNILASPKGGYSVGTNKIEVYLAENTYFYDSYTIDIVDNSIKSLSSEKAVIDYNSGYIKGLGTNLTRVQIENEIFDYGDATVTLTKPNKSFRYYGTGTTLTAVYPDGAKETFTFIIPGDVDGNGFVNYDDAGIVSKAVEDNSVLTKIQIAAADIDGIRRITANDLSVIVKMADK